MKEHILSGHRALAVELRTQPPAELSSLSDADAQHLASALKKARETQSAELDQSITEALKHIPWPLRGAVKKVVGL
jgi:hypothetical protein